MHRMEGMGTVGDRKGLMDLFVGGMIDLMVSPRGHGEKSKVIWC